MKQSDQSLPTFKVGDRVTVTTDISTTHQYETGKIIRMESVSGGIYIEFISTTHGPYGVDEIVHAKNHIIKQIIKDL